MSSTIRKPQPSEMCPPGYHVVRGHERICSSGTKTWVDAHIRRNRKKNVHTLLKENLSHLFWNSNKHYKGVNAVRDFLPHHELDPIIQFWLDYWKKQGLNFPKEIDPLLIKTIIAIESSFNPRAKAKTSSALGLMQITDQTRRILSGTPNKEGWRELGSNYLQLSKKDLEDPVVNIGAGIRWLAYKYKALPYPIQKTAFNVIKYYHSWDTEGQKYAEKIYALYKKSK